MSGQALWSGWWWPAATALTAALFAGLVFLQWLQRRRAHQLAWTVGLLMYGIAAGMEFWSEYVGNWSVTVYRFYIVMAAALVGYLGLGSAYLMIHKHRWQAHAYLVYNIAMTLVFLGGVFATDIQEELLVPGVTVGGQALGDAGTFPRIMSIPLTVPGSLFLLGGALVSIWRFARKREFAYRVWANVLIAAGTVLIAWAGAMARSGRSVALYPAELAALTLLLVGFLLAGTLQKGAQAAIAHGREQRAAEEGPAEESA